MILRYNNIKVKLLKKDIIYEEILLYHFDNFK
jgi:hypothetical protein